MASSDKPTLVFVPGAWHSPQSYDLVADILKKEGYPVQYVDLPSVGGAEPTKSFDPDVVAIRAVLEPLAESGKDVVVIAHSYGSMPTNEAINGLAKNKTKDPGGVIHYVFCCAFVTPVGVSLMDALQHNDLPWFLVSDDKTVVNPDTPEKIFYNDLSEDVQKKHVDKLMPFSYQAWYSKTSYAAYSDVPSTYIYCTEDQAIPFPVQQMMVENSGADFKTVTFEGSSHSPMLSRPEEVAKVIRTAAGG